MLTSNFFFFIRNEIKQLRASGTYNAQFIITCTVHIWQNGLFIKLQERNFHFLCVCVCARCDTWHNVHIKITFFFFFEFRNFPIFVKTISVFFEIEIWFGSFFKLTRKCWLLIDWININWFYFYLNSQSLYWQH